MLNLLAAEYNPEEIANKRLEITNRIIGQSECLKGGSITCLAAKDLELLFRLYDELFLHYWFRDCFKGKMKFSLSKRMTKSAGLTLCPKNIAKLKPEDLVIEIRIGVDFFFQYNEVIGTKMVCGIKTNDALEALLLVFEHELCHVLEFIN